MTAMGSRAIFRRQCSEAAIRMAGLLATYPKAVGVCAMPGVLVSVMRVSGISRDITVDMIDSAFRTMDGED